MTDLEALLKRLVDHHVEFVIVGGYAAVVHGVTLVTRDVDVCCLFSSENLHNLQRAVADLHPVHRMTPERLPLRLPAKIPARLKNLYLKTDLGTLDCLSEISGVGRFGAVARASRLVDLGFAKCRILDLDGLIKSKEAMNRPRDRETVLQLKAIKERQTRGR